MARGGQLSSAWATPLSSSTLVDPGQWQSWASTTWTSPLVARHSPPVQRSFYFRNLVHGGARMDALGLAADSFKVVSVYEGCLLMHELKGIPWTWDGQEEELGGRSTWRSSTSGDADFILDM